MDDKSAQEFYSIQKDLKQLRSFLQDKVIEANEWPEVSNMFKRFTHKCYKMKMDTKKPSKKHQIMLANLQAHEDAVAVLKLVDSSPESVLAGKWCYKFIKGVAQS